jgi:CRISPR-associated protein Cas2
MLVLVVYDIADDRRRTQLSNFLEEHGRRVQESVFECYLNLSEMQHLHQRVKRRIKLPDDNVRFYWIPADALPRTLTLGRPPPQPPPDVYIL